MTNLPTYPKPLSTCVLALESKVSGTLFYEEDKLYVFQYCCISRAMYRIVEVDFVCGINAVSSFALCPVDEAPTKITCSEIRRQLCFMYS